MNFIFILGSIKIYCSIKVNEDLLYNVVYLQSTNCVELFLGRILVSSANFVVFQMSSIHQSRALFEESRAKLCERVAANIQSTGSICRQIVKGSKTSDNMSTAFKHFASCDSQMGSTESNLKKISLTVQQLDNQLDAISELIDANSHKQTI